MGNANDVCSYSHGCEGYGKHISGKVTKLQLTLIKSSMHVSTIVAISLRMLMRETEPPVRSCNLNFHTSLWY